MVTISLTHPIPVQDKASTAMSLQSSLHISFGAVYERLLKWQSRFPIIQDDSIINGQNLLYLLTSKKFLDHRNSSHLARLILSIHLVQKKLQRAVVSSPDIRHLEIKWLPTELSFPFSTKSVMGCLIGFNLTDWYELFDEERVLLLLERNHPEIKVVKESSYRHILPNSSLKIIYFEIEKKDLSSFSVAERGGLKDSLERQIRGGFQKLAPAVFMRRNEEEVYKTILTLNREIHSTEDIPQVWISFEQQSKDEVVFLVVLVYVSARKNRLPIEQRFSSIPDCSFVSERHITVRHLQEHPIEAQVFRLHLGRVLSLIRSDGSLDFYSSRRQVVACINSAIGEFRDFNGGSLIKQRELLDSFKEHFPDSSKTESELMESFFYGITPLEKQALLSCDTLLTLFRHFLDHRHKKLDQETPYSFEIYRTPNETFFAVKACASWKDLLLRILERPEFKTQDLTYTMIEIPEGLFFHGILLNAKDTDTLIHTLQDALHEQHQSTNKRQVLRVGFEHSPLSLDPRVGGDSHSMLILQLLFEGLTRLDRNGKIENAMAESIDISSDFKCYVFKLREALWNDGSVVTAYDFDYAWKKVLSPDFKTTLANLFYPISYAKEAKEGKVPLHMVGIVALDESTLKVDLVHPTPYFLELTAQPLYYPVRQSIDRKHPQWPYQAREHYPCNGPFQLAINDPVHQTYRLIKNSRYWNSSSILLDEILMTQTNPHQALQAFQRNELDWIGSPFGSWYPSYVARQVDSKITIRDASVCGLVFNTLSPPFHHFKIRQALAHSIHREQLIANAFLPLSPAYSVLLPRQDRSPDACCPRQDVEKAQQLFHESLDELKITGKQLPTLQLICYQGGIREEIAVGLKQQLRDCLGLECHIKALPWNSFSPKMTKGDFQMSLVNWVPRIHDPITTLNAFRHADEETNWSNWEDPYFQHWLRLSDQEASVSKRSSYLMRAEGELSRAMPVIPLFYQPYQALMRQGLQASYHHFFDLARASFKEQPTNMDSATRFEGK